LPDQRWQGLHVQISKLLQRQVRVEKLANKCIISILLAWLKGSLRDDTRLIILGSILQEACVLILLFLFPFVVIPGSFLLFVGGCLLLLNLLGLLFSLGLFKS
jgi:hypothetical protein